MSEMAKKCLKCGQIKQLSYFYSDKREKDGRRTWCSECGKKETRRWAIENPVKAVAMKTKWKKENPDRHRETERKYQIEHAEQIRDNHRRLEAKYRRTVKGKLLRNIRSRIGQSLRGSKAGQHWEVLVGFTLGQLKKHIEKQFEAGMSWDNYGACWHIDHKIPVAAFNFERPDDLDFKKCWSLGNLQPLEAKKNFTKGPRLERPFQPSLGISFKKEWGEP